jgi:hypothetical protein
MRSRLDSRVYAFSREKWSSADIDLTTVRVILTWRYASAVHCQHKYQSTVLQRHAYLIDHNFD